nr:PREDICTED: cathepsin K-like [Bemisia tabaci]
MDDRSCDVHCNSIWGRVPLFNIPWSYGACAKDKSCVCRFNQKDLHQFTSNPCVQRSVWSSSFKGKRKIVSKEIKTQVVRLDSRQRFEVFKSAYGKQYGSQGEDLKRYDIFRKNLAIIDDLMARRKGNVVFGVGPFTDFTSEEFRRFVGIKKLRRRQLRPRMLNPFSRRSRSTNGQKPGRARSLSPGRPGPGDRPAPRRSVSVPPSYQPAPHNYKPWVGPDPQGQILLDWRIPDHLYPPTEAQTQFGRECDACWAFSTVGAVDIKLSRMAGRIGKVSVQALIDCDSQNYGCNGGNMEGALYFMKNNGVPSAAVYPYRAKTEVCKQYSPSVKTDYEEVDPEKVEERLMYSPLPSAIYFDPILQWRMNPHYS